MNLQLPLLKKAKGDEFQRKVMPTVIESGNPSQPPSHEAVQSALNGLRLMVFGEWREDGRDLFGLEVHRPIEYWDALRILEAN
jgi:hypothetical protein